MSDLLRVQRALQNHLLDPGAIEFTSQLDSIVIETDNVPREKRLHIYTNAYRARLVEALSTDFNALHTYLGDDAFEELIHAYIAQHPSHYFSLRNVGGNLADFLKNTEPYSAHVELHELAQFEWALCHAFDAADVGFADSAQFSALAPERWPELTLRFIPALRIVALKSNAPALWKMLNSEQAPPAVEIREELQHWIVWRHELKLLFRKIDIIEKRALDLFVTGATFADVCGALTELLAEDQVPQRAAVLMQQWLQDGLIARNK